MRAEQVTEPITHHGEGPVWWPRWQQLRLVDMFAGEVVTLGFDGPERTPVGGPLAAVIRPRIGGGAIVAREHDLAVSDRDDLADLRPVARVIDDPRLRCNEGGCDPQGRFYIGTMAYDQAERAGSVWRWDGEDTLFDTVSLLTVSNGLAWSPDGDHAYLNDSAARVTFGFTHDPARGPINRHRLIEHSDSRPDGMCVDADGGIWIAFLGAGQVRRFDAAGELTEVVEVPVSQPTACCFGGEDLRTLYITSSRDGLKPGDEPLAGSVFACSPGNTGLEVAGFAA